MTKVFVRGLEVYAYHGVSTEEQILGHRLKINLSAEVNQNAWISDDVEQTVNYAELARVASEVAGSGPFRTLEKLATEISRGVFRLGKRVESLEVEISKIAPPIHFIAEEVGVRMVFDRPHRRTD